MSAHSEKIGGSNAARVINCPGSWGLAQKLPKGPPSDYADEGTMLHNAMADILSRNVKEPHQVIGMRLGKHELTADLYDEMIEPALDVFENHIMLTDFDVEQTVSIPGLDGEFGTADVIGHNAEFTAVVDWKFGRGVYVSPKGNAQLRYYGVGARSIHSKWFKPGKPVRLYIIQPPYMIEGANDLEYLYDEIDIDELERFHAQLRRTTKTMQKKDAKFAAGDWCRFCPASAACPILTAKAADALENDGPLPPDELGRWLKEDAPLIEKLLADRRQVAHTQLEAGHAVPGQKLVAKRATRKFLDEGEAELELRRVAGLRSNDLKVSMLYNTTFKSVKQVEDAIKKAAPAKTAKKIRDRLIAILEPLYENRSSGTTLASDDDPRPAVMSGGAALKALADKLKVST